MEEQPIDYQGESGEGRSRRRSFERSSPMAPDRCGEGHVTIDTLSDDALLEICSSVQQISHPYESFWTSFWEMRWWIPLVHTCQRWRHIIFASPLRLRLVVPCRPPSAARKWESLDIWPPFPISVLCSSTKLGDYGSVVAALGHRERVFEISFDFQGDFEVETVAAVMEKPFPALKSLSLSSSDDVEDGVERYIPIPEAFLGGSAPSLRTLALSFVRFPALPRLLFSAPNLVSLTLENIPTIHCEAMATCLAALINLERLRIEGFARRSHYHHTSPPSLPRAVVPALTFFQFKGFDEYLDDFVARIDAPILRTILITFEFEFGEEASNFHIPQLHRFISSAERFKLPNRAFLWFAYATGCGHVSLGLEPLLPGSDRFLQIKCLQDSQMKLVCRELSPLLSRVDCLDLYVSMFMPVQESIPWLDIFRPFFAVQSLRVTEERWQSVAPVLRELTGERAMEVLPSLRTLVLGEFQPCAPIMAALEPFIAARQLSGHPVAIDIHHWHTDGWECGVQSQD